MLKSTVILTVLPIFIHMTSLSFLALRGLIRFSIVFSIVRAAFASPKKNP